VLGKKKKRVSSVSTTCKEGAAAPLRFFEEGRARREAFGVDAGRGTGKTALLSQVTVRGKKGRGPEKGGGEGGLITSATVDVGEKKSSFGIGGCFLIRRRKNWGKVPSWGEGDLFLRGGPGSSGVRREKKNKKSRGLFSRREESGQEGGGAAPSY